MIKIINQIREYKENHTDSELFTPDEEKRFCHVLEDVGRPNGVKIKAQTCIPEGVYDVAISRSSRFKKDMILLYNQDNQTVSRFGISFSGVRAHGGNDVDDSEGCPLTAYHSDLEGKVWGRASDDLLVKVQAWMDLGYKVKWVISSI